MPPPLHGLRALDLTDALGFLCGRVLADLGVEVIKVEPPGGDPGRTLAPRWRDAAGRDHGLYWWAANAGKLGITLDVTAAAARQVLADLAARVDFVLESFPPYSAAAALVADVASTRPWVIHTSVTAFGDRPPGRVRSRLGSDGSHGLAPANGPRRGRRRSAPPAASGGVNASRGCRR